MILLNKDQIRNLLPHREPMLLIDELYDIVDLTSATAVVNVKKIVFLYKVIFLIIQLCQEFLLLSHLDKLQLL